MTMKKMLIIPFILLIAALAYVANVADHLFGVVAYTYQYLAFCVIAAVLVGAACHACFKRFSPLITLMVFCLLSASFFSSPPSERLLRSAMLKARPGTDADAIEKIVKQAYEGSRFALPIITKSRDGEFDRVDVSLLSQQERSCTSLVFLVEDGLVVRSIFSGD